MIVTQAVMLRITAAENLAQAKVPRGTLQMPADWWRFGGVFVPMVCAGLALWLQRRSQSAWLRKSSTVGLAVLVPIGPLALLVALVQGPSALDSVRLPSGTRYVLAIEPIPTDSVYTLYRPSGLFGQWWRLIAWLDYSEDGRFTGGERLALSSDARWLLVERAGLWTDCFRLVHDRPVGCALRISPDWSEPGYEADMRARSVEIQRLTGMMPRG